MEVRIVETPVHGRALYEQRAGGRLLAGFHGYGENAELNLAALKWIPGQEQWSLLSIQALHRFYTRSNSVVASWMVSQDREHHIEDNIRYVARVLDDAGAHPLRVFLGFSQGVAMALRAAVRFQPAGVIALGGDVPPDVMDAGRPLPPVLLARGKNDEWYGESKFDADLQFLRSTTDVTTCVFDGGHEWSDEFSTAAGQFLKRIASL
jgi:predicted esterase